MVTLNGTSLCVVLTTFHMISLGLMRSQIHFNGKSYLGSWLWYGLEPLGQAPETLEFPIRVFQEILGSSELQPASLGTSKWDSENQLSDSPSRPSVPEAKRPSLSPYTSNILLSHSDPVTPGLFSGLGTVGVGKVPLGSQSFAITDLSCLPRSF